MVGDNVQTAVDAAHHLIVAHEVTNQGHDRSQLALEAQEATGCEQVTALADRGYFSNDQVLSCEDTGVNQIPNSAACSALTTSTATNTTNITNACFGNAAFFNPSQDIARAWPCGAPVDSEQ